jgi:N-acetylglutamate synthase-like GNAT family acetyltransferase
MEIKIRRTELKDKPWIKKLIETQWGSDFIVTRGRKYYYDKLEGFIAETKGINKGLITFRVEDREIEIIRIACWKEKG